jgi:hypothetical protein
MRWVNLIEGLAMLGAAGWLSVLLVRQIRAFIQNSKLKKPKAKLQCKI